MRDLPLHPQKPLVIEHVSDDIRELRKEEYKQQQVMFSGRAIADLLAGDTFNRSNPSDAKYYVTNRLKTLLDFDLVTDASIRYVGDSKCTNFPSSLANASGELKYTGFLYTGAVLPGGTLTWDENFYIKRYSTPTGGTEPVESKPISVRQIFYTDDLVENESYTRVGRYMEVLNTYTNLNEWKWVWSEWRSSTMQRVLVTDATRSILDKVNVNLIYEMHLCASVTLPDPDKYSAGTAIIFEQYSNNEAVYKAALTDADGALRAAVTGDVPSPLVRYYVLVPDTTGTKYHYTPAGSDQGWLTSFEIGKEYYIQSSPAAWISDVSFSEKIAKKNYSQNATGNLVETDEIVTQNYTTQLIPALDTLRTSDFSLETGDWTRNVASAVQYRFEIVDREVEIEGSAHTWMLDVDAEAVTRTNDIAELLDAHTDPMNTDIIQYGARQFRGSLSGSGTEGSDSNINTGNAMFMNSVPYNNRPLIVSKTTGMCGWAKFEITVNAASIASLPSNFGITFYRFNEFSAGFQRSTAFTYAVTTDATPNIYKKYYVVDGNGNFVLTGSNGYLTMFDTGTTYYERTINYGDSSSIEPATFVTADEGLDKTFKAKLFNHAGSTDKFKRSWFVSNPGKKLVGYIRCYRNDTLMVVIDSSKHYGGSMSIVSPTLEFYPDPHDTYLTKLHLLPNAITTEEMVAHPKPETINEEVAGPQSIVHAYELLARHLQSQGILFGSLPTVENAASLGESASTDFNSIIDQGIYTVNTSKCTNGPWITPALLEGKNNASLTVIASTAYSKNAKLPKTGDAFANGHTSASTVDLSQSGNFRVTQILVTCGATKNETRIWVRFGYASTVGAIPAANWSKWSTMQYPDKVFQVSGTTLSASTISSDLYYCRPTYVIHGNANVTLPSASSFPNAKIQIEVESGSILINDGAGNTYTNSAFKSSPHRMLYPLESDGTNWYLITVN